MKYFSTVVPVRLGKKFADLAVFVTGDFGQPVGEIDPQGPVVAVHQPDDLGLHLLDDPLPGFVEEFESQLPQPFAQPFPQLFRHRSRRAHHAQLDGAGFDAEFREQLPHDHPAAVAHHVADIYGFVRLHHSIVRSSGRTLGT